MAISKKIFITVMESFKTQRVIFIRVNSLMGFSMERAFINLIMEIYIEDLLKMDSWKEQVSGRGVAKARKLLL